MDNPKLTDQLFEHTKELKAEYILQTGIFAEKQFATFAPSLKRPIEDWYTEYGVKWERRQLNSGRVPNEKVEILPARGEYNRTNIYSMQRKMQQLEKAIAGGVNKFVQEKKQDAEKHYEDSIKKLSYRIAQKGITENTIFEISSAQVGMNFECVIKHDGRVTRAFTILAWGPVNAPHYRYLIK